MAACVRRSCSCSRLITWSLIEPLAALQIALRLLRHLLRLLDLRVDFGELDLRERLALASRASPSCTRIDLMTPPTLNDSRISSFVATMPLVAMAGVAGPGGGGLHAHGRRLRDADFCRAGAAG